MKNLRKLNATFLWLSIVLAAVWVLIFVFGMALHELGNKPASDSLEKPFIYIGVSEVIVFALFVIGAGTELFFDHLNEN
jgi:hypothetical protein